MLNQSAQDAYRFILDFKKANDGLSPSVREICQGIGRASPSTVYLALTDLEQHGLISFRADGAARNIIVTGGCWQPPRRAGSGSGR